VTVRLRRTEFEDVSTATLPFVSASIVDTTGRSEMVRLWPAAEPGSFEGSITASDAGRRNLRVTADTGATADAVLLVDPQASLRRGVRLDGIPERTGGVAVQATDLEPLVRHLASLPRPSHLAAVHPMRSAWWMIPFAGTLCGEWLLRRRSGAR
jgi:hypothetical protein